MVPKESFTYLGYTLTKCDWKRESNDFSDKIRVGIENINLNSKSNEFSISYKFDFLKGKDIISHITFQSWFRLHDEDLINAFNKLVSNPLEKMPDILSNSLLMMVHLSFPFIRQSLFSMTNDLRGAINIPITDSVKLLNGGVEFNRLTEEK